MSFQVQLVTIRDVKYSLTVPEAFTGLMGTQQEDVSTLTLTLRDAVQQSFDISDTCMLVVGHVDYAFTIGVFRDGNYFHCFDSHSRTAAGLPTPNGKDVLLLIKRLAGLVGYINELAKSLFGAERSLNHSVAR